MAIDFIAGGSAAADTLTLPTLTVGDTIIAIAQAPAAGSVSITIPGSWWSHRVQGTSAGRSHAYAVHFVDDASFSFGTWTLAEKVSYLIFRSDAGGIVYPMNLNAATVGTGTSLSHPTVNSNVFLANLNDIRMLLVASASIIDNGAEDAITGYTQIYRSTLASNDLVVDLSDALLSSFSVLTRTMDSSTNTFGSSFVLKELPFLLPDASGGSRLSHPMQSQVIA